MHVVVGCSTALVEMQIRLPKLWWLSHFYLSVKAPLHVQNIQGLVLSQGAAVLFLLVFVEVGHVVVAKESVPECVKPYHSVVLPPKPFLLRLFELVKLSRPFKQLIKPLRQLRSLQRRRNFTQEWSLPILAC